MTGSGHSQSSKERDREAGFSLLEIMIALAILALATALVGVAFARSSTGFRFEAAAQDLTLTLREAHARALRSGRDIAVVLDVDAHTYQLHADRPIDIPNDTAIRVVSASQAMTSTRRPAFSFSPDGGSTGGSIVLSQADRSATITVDWLTGAVEMTTGGADDSAS